MSVDQISAVVVEPVALARRGLEAMTARAGITKVQPATSVAEGVRLAELHGCSVAVIGGTLDLRPAAAVTRFSAIGVAPVVITPVADLMSAYRLYQAGALGVLSPNAEEDEFCQLIAAAARRQRYVPSNLLRDALDRPAPPPAGRSSGVGLTQREHDVLSVLARGHTNRQIADELCIGVETVKTHLNSIYAKFSVSRRSQAVSLAIRNRLI